MPTVIGMDMATVATTPHPKPRHTRAGVSVGFEETADEEEMV
jgi:hypothetical protein